MEGRSRDKFEAALSSGYQSRQSCLLCEAAICLSTFFLFTPPSPGLPYGPGSVLHRKSLQRSSKDELGFGDYSATRGAQQQAFVFSTQTSLTGVTLGSFVSFITEQSETPNMNSDPHFAIDSRQPPLET